jgi:hypothetical protein
MNPNSAGSHPHEFYVTKTYAVLKRLSTKMIVLIIFVMDISNFVPICRETASGCLIAKVLGGIGDLVAVVA